MDRAGTAMCATRLCGTEGLIECWPWEIEYEVELGPCRVKTHSISKLGTAQPIESCTKGLGRTQKGCKAV